MSSDLQTILKEAVDAKVFPGVAVAVVHLEGAPEFFTVGTLRYTDTCLVTPDTLYDVASVTKSIPTSCIALQLIEEGVFKVDDAVQRFLPELRTQYAPEITLWHLLTQTLCFELRLSELKKLPGPQILERILQASMACPPGEKYYYVNATSILLSLVLEKVLGQSLNVVARERFFEPLEMQHTTFSPHEEDGESTVQSSRQDIAPSEIDENWRYRELVGEVQDESAWQLRQSGIVVGSAGLFSTARDIAKFLQMLLQTGTWGGKHFFRPETINLMQTNQARGRRGEMGLGWELAQPWMGQAVSNSAFGKTGYTGCCVVVDPVKKIGIVMLSNATYPYRPVDRAPLTQTRQQVISSILENTN